MLDVLGGRLDRLPVPGALIGIGKIQGQVKALFVQAGAPVGQQEIGVGHRFILAGIEGGHIAGLGRGIRADSLIDLLTALAGPRGRHPFKLPQAMLAGDLCFKAHRLDVLAQGVAVYLPERQLVVEHVFAKPGVHVCGITTQRPPFAFGPGGIEHQRVGVQLWIELAGGVVGIEGGHYVAGGLGARDALSHDAGAGQRLDLLHGDGHGAVVGLKKALVPFNQGHHRDGLGGGESEVIAGAVGLLAIHDARELGAVGEFPLGHGIEGGPLDGATEAQTIGPLANPD